MARIVGSTFKPGIPARQPRQETAMDRALASFVSPQGVYLLAQGIGALGKLPWQSKEGGVGLMKQAAASRNEKAQAVLKQAEALHKDIKPGATAEEVQTQRGKIMPYEDEEMEQRATPPIQGHKLRQEILAQGQREGETHAEFKARFEGRTAKRDIPLTGVGPVVGEGESATSGYIPSGKFIPRHRTAADAQDERRLRDTMVGLGKPEDIAETAQGRRQRHMIEAAREAGRDVGEVDLAIMDEEELRNKINEAFMDAEVSTEDLESMSNDELMEQAVKAQEANRNLRKSSRAVMDMFGQQADPYLVQQNIEASVKRRQEFNQRIRRELKRRATTIQAADPVKFIEGRIAKQIAGLDPVEQKAELRRLAKSVRTQEDKDEVMSLAARFKPVRSTVGDYFTSDDDLRTEFEEELNKILPTIDPLFAVKKRQMEATAGLHEAQATQVAGENATKIAMEMIRGEAAMAKALGKDADKAASASKAAREKQNKKLEGIKKALASAIKFPDVRVRLLKDADDIINGSGSFQSKYSKIYGLTKKYEKALLEGGIVNRALAQQQISDINKAKGAMPDKPKPKPKPTR